MIYSIVTLNINEYYIVQVFSYLFVAFVATGECGGSIDGLLLSSFGLTSFLFRGKPMSGKSGSGCTPASSLALPVECI